MFDRTSYTVDQSQGIGRYGIAAPGDVLVGTRQHELVPIQRGGFVGVHIQHRKRHAANFAAATSASADTDRSNRNSVKPAPIASYSDRPSRSQTCGTRHPGTVDGVKSYIVYGGAVSPS